MADSSLSLQKMQVVSWVVLVLLTGVSAIFMSLAFAWSVLVGGLISIASFFISNKDIAGLIDSVASLSTPEDRRTVAQQRQKGYLLKFWLRIVIIGVLLLLLIKWKLVNIFGLILGLSTVVISVTFIAVNEAGSYFFRGRR